MGKRALVGALTTLLVTAAFPGSSAGDNDSDYLYGNLMKSRDALLAQQDELARAKNDVLAAIDRLNQKAARIDQYMDQVADSLRDVNNALDHLH